jgi:hypothetical protein
MKTICISESKATNIVPAVLRRILKKKHIQHSYYGQGMKVQAQTSETALHHLAQALALARRSYGSKYRDNKPVSYPLYSYNTDDIAP